MTAETKGAREAAGLRVGLIELGEGIEPRRLDQDCGSRRGGEGRGPQHSGEDPNPNPSPQRYCSTTSQMRSLRTRVYRHGRMEQQRLRHGLFGFALKPATACQRPWNRTVSQAVTL